jgi:hypothetical protein
LVRIRSVQPLGGFNVRLGLTDGSVIERDLDELIAGRVFEHLRAEPAAFRAVTVDGGTLAWPNGADLCPDVVIWGGEPPTDESERPPMRLRVKRPGAGHEAA